MPEHVSVDIVHTSNLFLGLFNTGIYTLTRLHGIDLFPILLSPSNSQYLREHKAGKLAQDLCLVVRILIMPFTYANLGKDTMPVGEIAILFHEGV